MQNGQSIPCLSAFEQHHDDLLRFFTRKLGCRDLAADCTQDTYMHLARMRTTSEVQNPRAYLFRVAANLAVDNLRKMRTRRGTVNVESPPEDTPSSAPSAEDVLEAKQRVIQLGAAIDELSPNCRNALLLNRLEGKTHREIARHLGVSESMVAKYIVQALKHCRARLEQGEPLLRT